MKNCLELASALLSSRLLIGLGIEKIAMLDKKPYRVTGGWIWNEIEDQSIYYNAVVTVLRNLYKLDKTDVDFLSEFYDRESGDVRVLREIKPPGEDQKKILVKLLIHSATCATVGVSRYDADIGDYRPSYTAQVTPAPLNKQDIDRFFVNIVDLFFKVENYVIQQARELGAGAGGKDE